MHRRQCNARMDDVLDGDESIGGNGNDGAAATSRKQWRRRLPAGGQDYESIYKVKIVAENLKTAINQQVYVVVYDLPET